jgi:hypothetical protein
LIRRGKNLEQKINLGEAPEVRRIDPMSLVPPQAADIDRLMKGPFGQDFGMRGFDREFMESLERAFGKPGEEMQRLRMEFQNNGSIRFEDREGSVEIRTKGEDRSVIVRDKEGNVLFEGPYNTPEEKEALPEKFRERVERLDVGNGASGFQFRFQGFPEDGE